MQDSQNALSLDKFKFLLDGKRNNWTPKHTTDNAEQAARILYIVCRL